MNENLNHTDKAVRERLYSVYVTKYKAQSEVSPERHREAIFAAYAQDLLPLLSRPGPAARILEVGCGAGLCMEFLREHGFENVEGIDISAEQVGLATEKGLDVHRGDALPFLRRHAETFDAVLAMDVIEHLFRAEVLAFMDLVMDSLVPGGRFIARTPNGSGLFSRQIIYDDFTHFSILTPESFRQVACATGFTDIRVVGTRNRIGGAKGLLHDAFWYLFTSAVALARRAETGKHHKLWTENMICSCRKPTVCVPSRRGAVPA